MKPLSDDILAKLRAVDTPTICNAIEEIEGKRRADNFTRYPVVSCNIKLPAICGYAKTGTIRAAHAPTEAKDVLKKRRLDYYRYLSKPPAPSLVVIEDLDHPKGVGAYWGEVQTNIHKALGVVGALTDGSIRDLDMLAEGFHLIGGSVGPSHAFVHMTAYDVPVTVFGLTVRPGDLVHADRHGAVVIAPEMAAELPRGLELNTRREAPILKAARTKGFTVDKLIAAMGEADDVH